MILFALLSLALAGGDAVSDGELVADAGDVPQAVQSKASTAPRAVQPGGYAPLPYAETHASLEPARERLRQVLALETWESGPDLASWVNLGEPLEVVAPLLVPGTPSFGTATQAMAATETHGLDGADWWDERWTRSNYKVQRDAGGRIQAVAFGLQRETNGRGLSRASLDILVVFAGGRPSEVLAVNTHSWGTVDERHYTLTWRGGDLSRVEEVRVEGVQTWEGKGVKGLRNTSAERQTWS